MLPTFIHIGPGRTATTMLYEAFKEHPDICMSTIKETNYFTDQEYHRGIDWYQSFFGHCTHSMAVGEVSNAYFHCLNAPERMNITLPNVKIVTVLRNPFDYIRSLCAYTIRKGMIDSGTRFEEILEKYPEIITHACYYNYLQGYLERFPAENVMISLFDDLIKDPTRFIQSIYMFIGVSCSFVPGVIKKRVNPSVSARYTLLNSFAYRVARHLRRWNLHSMLNWAKRSNITRSLLFKTEESSVSLVDASLTVYKELMPHLLPQIKELERISGKTLEGWYKEGV